MNSLHPPIMGLSPSPLSLSLYRYQCGKHHSIPRVEDCTKVLCPRVEGSNSVEESTSQSPPPRGPLRRRSASWALVARWHRTRSFRGMAPLEAEKNRRWRCSTVLLTHQSWYHSVTGHYSIIKHIWARTQLKGFKGFRTWLYRHYIIYILYK